ncbi:MAG: hypothetical protein WBH90_02105 [Aggregatilineales bacterium]|nr:hypothetical protein [Chloroflexota bacterium]HOA24090.1 hypothetical protein [Aggregatilineales bacterium]HPV08738.1 hypothetical protein [Aggregatilineales bacterium]HQE19301.1 hypothetical protein [Aggregatilineales bacterium]
MRLSFLQPEIIPGDAEHNVRAVQHLIDEAEGDLLVLPEYVLTGPPTPGMDVAAWAAYGASVRSALNVPPGKAVLINTLVERGGEVVNCCELLDTGQQQAKLYLTDAERAAGISAGHEQHVFSFGERQFAVCICERLMADRLAPAEQIDFALWISHFDRAALPDALASAREVSEARGVRVFMSALLTDEHVGVSAYVDGKLQLAVPRRRSIMEVVIA